MDALKAGLQQSEDTRVQQLRVAAFSFAFALVLLALAARAGISGTTAVTAVAHAILCACAALCAYFCMLRMESFKWCFVVLFCLATSSLSLTFAMPIMLGWPASCVSLAAGLLCVGVLHAWVSFVSAAPETLAYKRAIMQTGVLLLRPPAVVA